jgi:hypothetical protein|tara:strand:- start:6618 stop:7085 length:468 start_codon:yes stop_codon:yes gene_type:complete
MLTDEELQIIYEWGMTTELPYRKAPTAEGYSNQPIDMCWLKGTRGFKGVRTSLVDDPKIVEILDRDEVLFATGALFHPNTELPKHRDPDVYPYKYRRIHIPLVVDPEKCYMIWEGKKVNCWESGKFSVWDVQDHIHEAYNYSEEPMEFIFIDIKK